MIRMRNSRRGSRRMQLRESVTRVVGLLHSQRDTTNRVASYLYETSAPSSGKSQLLGLLV